ncbi:MAG: radical SAM protein [Firmicutes bacterium]|nr:radical SAM protein [Bacillota bacterium]
MNFTEKYLKKCYLCPHKCGINRINGEKGICGAGLLPKVALASLHFWEEPCISGTAGSGAVFFSHCNLSCVFCQNYKISQEGFGKEISIEQLSKVFLNLQEKGASNINLVSATQYIPQVAEALLSAKKIGLTLPIIYNSNGYETIEALQLLYELIDVYLPDLKYESDYYSLVYSAAPDYFKCATSAILEMYRQVGNPVFNSDDLIQKGLIIRHLILPGLQDDSKKVLDWIRNHISIEVPISIMAQYTPVFKAESIKELNRRITKREYENIIDYFFEIGLETGYVQERSSASSKYTPVFNLGGIE